MYTVLSDCDKSWKKTKQYKGIENRAEAISDNLVREVSLKNCHLIRDLE